MQQHLSSKLQNYAAYLYLTPKQRRKRIDKAQQDKQPRANPQGNHKFPQTNFLPFQVAQDSNTLNLVTYRYPAREDARAVLVMFHGLNSHIGHGAHLAQAFSQNNITTVGFDHRGFGQSPGTPGKVTNLQEHLRDSLNFVSMIKGLYKDLPIFILGLSMGGMTTYHLSLRYPELFQGAIMMAPAIKNLVGGFMVGTSKILRQILPENMSLTKPVYGQGSKNPQITQDVKVDPYVFKERFKLSTVNTLLHTMQITPQTFKYYKCPFMIVQGGLDKMVNPEGAFDLFQQSITPHDDKEILFYEHMWHDIWHQDQINQIIEKVLIWVNGRLKIRVQKGNHREGLGLKEQEKIKQVLAKKEHIEDLDNQEIE